MLGTELDWQGSYSGALTLGFFLKIDTVYRIRYRYVTVGFCSGW